MHDHRVVLRHPIRISLVRIPPQPFTSWSSPQCNERVYLVVGGKDDRFTGLRGHAEALCLFEVDVCRPCDVCLRDVKASKTKNRICQVREKL